MDQREMAKHQREMAEQFRRSEEFTKDPRDGNPIGIISALASHILSNSYPIGPGLRANINRLVSSKANNKQTSLDVGGRAIAIALAQISSTEKTLYGISYFLGSENMQGNMDKLGLDPEGIERRKLGRALNHLGKISPEGLKGIVSDLYTDIKNIADTLLSGREKDLYEKQTRHILIDTTSRAIHHNPERMDFLQKEEDNPPLLSKGYVKDRSDWGGIAMKQLVMNEGTKVRSVCLVPSNEPDVKLFPKVIEQIAGEARDSGEKLVVIMDAAASSREAFSKVHEHKLLFITRGSNSFKVTKKLRSKGKEGYNFERVGRLSDRPDAAVYFVAEAGIHNFGIVHKGKPLLMRVIAVKSELFSAAEKERLRKYINDRYNRMKKAVSKCNKREAFRCKEDAEKEKARLEREIHKTTKGLYSIEVRILEQVGKHKTAGRPRKGEVPPTVYKLCVEVPKVSEYDPDAYEQLKKIKERLFFLVTTVPQEEMSKEEVLHAYKDLKHVERTNHLIKSDKEAGGTYMHSKEGIIGRHFIVCIATMIRRLLELLVRFYLKCTKKTVRTHAGTNKRNDRVPTVRTISKILNSGSIRCRIVKQREQYMLVQIAEVPDEWAKDIKTILEAFGLTRDDLYAYHPAQRCA